MRHPLLEVTGERERDGTRGSRDTPLNGGRDQARATASNEESKRIQRRTLPLLVRRRGEATKAATGGDGEGSLLSTMVVLRVDVA